MKFSQDVSARIDLELNNANAGDSTSGDGGPNRFGWGIDQAYVQMNDFLFRNLSLKLGKQNFNISLRDNKSNNWAWGDPLGMVATYSTRDMDLKFYYLKYDDATLSSTTSNDEDENLIGIYTEYWLNDDSLLTGYLNRKDFRGGVTDSNGATRQIDNLFHYGVGIDYFIGESLEIFGEVAAQTISGDDALNAANDGSAYQFNLGGEYTFSDYETKPQLSLEYYVQSGEDAGDPALARCCWRMVCCRHRLYLHGKKWPHLART